jgi:GNAT superfamily N-acetyltransferase
MTLTNRQLERLSLEALVALFDQGAGFEAHLAPGCSLVLSGEPVADLNNLLAGGKATVEGFVAGASTCLERELPFLSILFPEVAEALAGPAAELGLQHAVEFPFMVATGVPAAVELGELTVRRAAGEEGARASAQALHRAFGMPVESALRALPASFLDSPALKVWIAELDATCVGTVTLTLQGDTAGVWAMGVDPQVQRRGVGRRLLTTAMREAATRSVRRFYLGATPAGKPLYDRLGFATQLVTQVWASGESGQT